MTALAKWPTAGRYAASARVRLERGSAQKKGIAAPSKIALNHFRVESPAQRDANPVMASQFAPSGVLIPVEKQHVRDEVELIASGEMEKSGRLH